MTTINAWLSILEASYILFLLPPFFENVGKRLIKSPKLYFYDTGLASYLLGIENVKQIERDPLMGHLFENLVIANLRKTRYNQALDDNLFFYRDSNGVEVDLIFKQRDRLIPIEIKSASTFNGDFFKSLKYLKKLMPQKIKKAISFIQARKKVTALSFLSFITEIRLLYLQKIKDTRPTSQKSQKHIASHYQAWLFELSTGNQNQYCHY